MLTNLKGTPYFGGEILWHPVKEVVYLVAATSEHSCRLLSFDARSGCQLQSADCRFLPASIVAVYSTAKLHRESMHHLKSRNPLVYFTLAGAPGLRVLDTGATSAPAAGDKGAGPMTKLRCEASKAAIVALAAHPTDAHTLFLTTAGGRLCGRAARPAEAAWQPGFTLALGAAFAVDRASSAAVALAAAPHPIRAGWALVAVRTAGACVAVEVHGAQEARAIGQIPAPVTGSTLCGAGFVHGGRQLVAAARLPGRRRHAARAGPAATRACPRTRPRRRASASSSCSDGADPAGRLGAPRTVSVLDSTPGFWTAEDGAAARDGDGADASPPAKSKLRFPRYAHLLADERVAAYDVSHGLLSDAVALPPALRAARRVVAALRPPRGGLWALLCEALGDGEGETRPGARDAALLLGGGAAAPARGPWFLPGASLAFVGGDAASLAVLSESGRSLAVYDAAALRNAEEEPRPRWACALGDAGCAALLPGPPAHVAAPPEPKPSPPEDDDGAGSGDEDKEDDASSTDSSSDEDVNSPAAVYARELRAWEARELARLEPPRLVAALARGGTALTLLELPQNKPSSARDRLAPRASIALEPGEALVSLRWQSLTGPGPRGGPLDACQLLPGARTGAVNGAGAATNEIDDDADQQKTVIRADPRLVACVGAVLTTRRVLFVSERLVPIVSARLPSDAGVPVSSLWLGPLLLLTTSAGQLLSARWDGSVGHVATLLDGPGAGLGGPGRAAGALPGGRRRVAAALRALAASYDLTRLPAALLRQAAATGTGRLASALAARSEAGAAPGSATSALTTNALRSAVFAAEAGDWSPLVELMLTEWQAGPCGTAGSAPRGACSRPRAPGPSCSRSAPFQGDWAGLAAAARASGDRGVRALGDQILAVNEDAFRGIAARSAYGGRACTADWQVRAVPRRKDRGVVESDGQIKAAAGHDSDEDAAEGDAYEAEKDSIAADGLEDSPLERRRRRSPADDEESVPIPPLEAGALASYSAASTPVRAGFGDGMLSRVSPSAASVTLEEPSRHGAPGAAPRSLSRLSDWGSESTVSTAVPSVAKRGRRRARQQPAVARQAAGARPGGRPRRPAKQEESDDEDDFFDSDDDGGDAFFGAAARAQPHRRRGAARAGAARRRGAAGARGAGVGLAPLLGDALAERPARSLSKGGGSQRFNFKIRDLDGEPNAASNSQSLRTAVQGLKLAPPAPSPSASGRRPLERSLTGASSAPSDVDPFSALSGLGAPPASSDPFDFFASAPAPSAAPAAAPASASKPMVPPPQASKDLLAGWEDFENLFAAPSAPATAPSAPAIAPPPARELRDSASVNQFAAAALLAADAKSPVEAARLARFAAAVPLEGAEAALVLWAAAQRQVAVKNYGIAASMLSKLVLSSMTAVPTEKVQELLNTCDRAGDTNAVPPEDTSAFASLLAACPDTAGADELVANIVRG
ncbi:hypothetical protein QBZ16_002972 [Prototheca wickerhamii]|uniref:Uncharacterized protein n=1 Tax=Prototheca wickerhamii TaxID=3111 RepID=A0AAD9IIY6_PROWI|nr:hypothetical protein QBZ16_002972 [Prototheca wickerhamii]